MSRLKREFGMAGAIDWEKVREIERDVGRDSTNRLLLIFATECDKSCREMTRLSEDGECHQIEVIAHSLKSSALQFGAVRLSGHCRDLEAITNNNERAEIDRYLKPLLAEAEKVLISLKDRPGL